MRSFDQYLKKSLEDKEFAQTYEETKAELNLGLALSKQREALGLTQEQVADLTGIKQPMLARIERGQMPKVATLQKIAKALKVGVFFTADQISVVKAETVALGGFVELALERILNTTEANIPLSNVVDMEDYRNKKKREPFTGKVGDFEDKYEDIKSVVG